MGHQPETAGGVADVRGVFIPWGQIETFTVGGLLLALVIAIVKLVVGVSLSCAVRNIAWPVCVLILLRALPGRVWFCILAFVSLLAA